MEPLLTIITHDHKSMAIMISSTNTVLLSVLFLLFFTQYLISFPSCRHFSLFLLFILYDLRYIENSNIIVSEQFATHPLSFVTIGMDTWLFFCWFLWLSNRLPDHIDQELLWINRGRIDRRMEITRQTMVLVLDLLGWEHRWRYLYFGLGNHS